MCLICGDKQQFWNPIARDPLVSRHGFDLLLCSWNVFFTLTFFPVVFCSEERRSLANCSASWRRKTWRSSTKGKRKRWCDSFIEFNVRADVCIFAFCPFIRLRPLFCSRPLGAAGLPSVSLAGGPRGPRGAVHGGLPPPAALLDAGVVRQIHLHPYHSPWCQSGIAALHSKSQVTLQ